MTIMEKVNEILLVSPSVTALVEDRIRPPGGQRITRPYIVHFPVALRPNYTHGTVKQSLQTWDIYQFSCFGDTYSSARNVAEALKLALSGHHDGCHFFIVNEFTDYESDVGIYHIGVEFKVAESLSA